jgi:WD40 repeat protein/energy-coupling factor transporter ATP-binding protein EcfA2
MADDSPPPSSQVATGTGIAQVLGSGTAIVNIAGDKIDGYTAGQVSVLLAQISATFQPKPFDGRCPYVGLDVFEEKEEDAARFFGRERLVAELVARVKASHFVVVVGPSGSGKSSLVRAGLIYTLKQGALPGSERWLYATMKPGRDPIEQLAWAMSRMTKSPDAGDYICRNGMSDVDTLHKSAETVLSDRHDQRAVIVVDQFEEIFTQVSKQDERVAFLNLLTRAATLENGRVCVLVVMRSDFVPNCATYPQLNALLNQQFFQVGVMQPEELVSAIALPALHVGLKVDPDLIAQIIYDMQDEPGTLPLMQFALKDLFDARQAAGGMIALTLTDYLARGGTHKSLERHADAAFARLSEIEQQLARAIFTGLVEIGRGTRDTSRTATFEELVPAGADKTEVETVIHKLADARLVTTDDKAISARTVTLAHEKLIDAWPWLHKLVNENRDAIALQNQIAQDAQEWEQHRRDPSYLYAGARLATAREQLAANKIVLSRLAQAFIDAGVEAEEAEQRREDARRQKELEAERQAATRLRARNRIITGIGAIALFAAIIAVFFGVQSNQSTIRANQNAATAQAASTLAVQQRDEAQRQARIAHASQLATQATVIDKFPQRSLLVALEALNVTLQVGEPRVPAAESALRQVISYVGRIPSARLRGRVTYIAFSPDGRWLATAGGYDYIARLWKADDLKAEPIVLRGHDGYVFKVLFSPDGRWLATGSWDGTVRVWEVNNLVAKPMVLRGITTIDADIAFSQDGHWLATICRTETVCLWNTEHPNTAPIELPGHTDVVDCVAFSPDGRWLATGGDNGMTMLWKVDDPMAGPVVLQGHADTVNSVVFSPDGRWLASVSADDTARLWAMYSPTFESVVLSGHTGAVFHVAFSPDGRWLATGGYDGTTRLWNVSTSITESVVLPGNQSSIRATVFSPDGRWLATAGEDNTVQLWEVDHPTTKPVVLRGHDDAVDSVAFSPDGRWLATGSDDGTVGLWDMVNPTMEPEELRGQKGPVKTMAHSFDGRWLATSDRNTIRLWNTTNVMAEPVVMQGHEYEVTSIAFSPDGHWIATASGDHTARLWAVDNPTGSLVLQELGDAGTSVVFSPDGHWLATGGGTAVRLWSMGNLAAKPIEWTGMRAKYTGVVDSAVAFSPDGRWLAIGRGEAVQLWQVDDPGAAPVTLRGQYDTIAAMMFSPDGRWLAVGSGRKAAYLWAVDNPTAEPMRLYTGGSHVIGDGVFPMAFSPDAHWLATGGSEDNNVGLWALEKGEAKLVVLRGHEGKVKTLTFSPDGHWLATGGDSTIRLWEVDNWIAESVLLRGHEGNVNVLAFSPDGQRLVTAGDDGIVRLWYVKLDKLIELACHTVSRNLTLDEWTQYFKGEPYRATCPNNSVGGFAEADTFALQGDTRLATLAFAEAVRTASEIYGDSLDNASLNNTVCRLGSIDGFAKVVLPACERAVKLTSGTEHLAAARDRRGLARALTGDYIGAVEDFQYVVEWLQKKGWYDVHDGARREAWITELKRGQNPFDSKTLETLRSLWQED